MIVDNAPDGMAGEWDATILQADWGLDELDDLGLDLQSMLDIELDDRESEYANKIVSPVYEPKGINPPIDMLTDRRKTDKLQAEIDDARLPADVSKFLKDAAERHTIFYFGKIAEFYCHAPPQVQDLMEKSGMVIIDFEKAIENGFVNLTDRLGKLADLETSNVNA